MNGHEDDGTLSSMDSNRLQMKILAQLFRVTPTFNHIDDLLEWLAHILSQQFNARLVQFWSNQINHIGQRTAQLRTMVRQDTSVPVALVASEDVAQFAQRIAHEQRIYHPQSVNQHFLPYRATSLRRYGLNFFAACFIYANLHIPEKDSSASEEIITPLAITVLLFLPQEPRIDFMPSVVTIMNQAMTVARTRGLLRPLARQLTTPKIAPEPQIPPLESVIPRHKQNTRLMPSNNALPSATGITNRSARLLYSAIDGHSDLAALCARTGLPISEAYKALQMLLVQQRVEVYTPSGTLINPNFLLKH